MLVDTELKFDKYVLSLYLKAVIKICNGEVSSFLKFTPTSIFFVGSYFGYCENLVKENTNCKIYGGAHRIVK